MTSPHQVHRATRKAVEAFGLKHDGSFKLDGGWVFVDVTFYPSTVVWITDLEEGVPHGKPVISTRRRLDKATAAKLEDWL